MVAALIALSACGQSSMPPRAGATPPSTGRHRRLHIEPIEIAFKRGRGVARAVRVWERHYDGRYTDVNRCSGISVTLERYTKRNASIWRVAALGTSRESCRIEFVGNSRAGAINYLKIRVLK